MMSTGRHRGPLTLLNVSEEEAWQRRQHRMSTAKAYEVLLGCPPSFEDISSIDDAFEQVSGVERPTLRAAEVLRRVFMPASAGINGVTVVPNLLQAARRTRCTRSVARGTLRKRRRSARRLPNRETTPLN